MNEQVNLAITLESLQATARMKAFSAEVQKGTQLVNKMGQPLGDLSKSVKAASTSFFSLRSAISAAFGGSVLLLMFRGVRAMGEWAKAAKEQEAKVKNLVYTLNVPYATALRMFREKNIDANGAVSDLTTQIGALVNDTLKPATDQMNSAASATAGFIAQLRELQRLQKEGNAGAAMPSTPFGNVAMGAAYMRDPAAEAAAAKIEEAQKNAALGEAWKAKKVQPIDIMADFRAKFPLSDIALLEDIDTHLNNFLKPAALVLEKIHLIPGKLEVINNALVNFNKPILGDFSVEYEKITLEQPLEKMDKLSTLIPGIALETRKVGDEWEAVGMRMEQAFVGAAYGSGNFFQNVVAGFRNMLQQMAALLAAKAAVFAFLNMVTGGSFSIAQGGLGGFLGGLKGIMGFAQGGWTGELGGLVHQHEYVVPEWLTKKAPGTIAALENARRGGNGGNVNMTFNVSGNNRELETLFRDRLVPMIRNAKRSGLLESV